MERDIFRDFFKGIEQKVDSSIDKLKKADKSVSYDVLFNKQFMTDYTSTDSISKFFEEGGFNMPSGDISGETIDLETLNKYISDTTKFSNWDSMKSKAIDLHIRKIIDWEKLSMGK